MKKINFELPKKKEQFKIDVVRSVENNDTIYLATCFAKPLFKFMNSFCACIILTSSTDRNVSLISVREDPDARFIPTHDGVILEVLVTDSNAEPRLVIEEE